MNRALLLRVRAILALRQDLRAVALFFPMLSIYRSACASSPTVNCSDWMA